MTFWITVHQPVRLEGEAESTLQSVKTLLVEGLKRARRLVEIPPLLHLSSGKEAIDTTLFDDATMAKQAMKVLYGKAPKRTTPAMERAGALIRTKVKEVALSDEYLGRYVERHSVFSGNVCGSCRTVPPTKFVSVLDSAGMDPNSLLAIGGVSAEAVSMRAKLAARNL